MFDFKKYEAKAKTMTDAELLYVIRDCREAAEAIFTQAEAIRKKIAELTDKAETLRREGTQAWESFLGTQK